MSLPPRPLLTACVSVCQSLPMSQTLLTYAEAAARLGVSKRTLHRYIEDGLLVPTRVQITPRSTAPRLAASDVDRIKTAAVA